MAYLKSGELETKKNA